MWLIEVVRTIAELAPRFNQLSVFRELVHSRRRRNVVHRPRRMTFGDEDVAVRRDEHRVGLREILRVSTPAWFAERHQQLAVGAELEDLMPLGLVRRRWLARGCRRAGCAAASAPAEAR